MITLINETIFFVLAQVFVKESAFFLPSTRLDHNRLKTKQQKERTLTYYLLLTTRVKRKEKTNTALSHLHTYTHTFSHSLLHFSLSLSLLPIFLLVCPVYFKSRFTFLLYLVHFIYGLFMQFVRIFYFWLNHHCCL